MRLIFTVIFTIVCFNCKSLQTKNKSNESAIIINNVIKLKGLDNYIFNKNYSLNKNLLELLNDNIILENGEYAEFGDLRNIVNDSIINDVFNEFEFKNLVEQLENNPKTSKYSHNNSIINKEINYTLSEPIFCNKKPYAIIMYSYGNRLHEIGGSGVLLLKKINNNWVLINEIWGTMS